MHVADTPKLTVTAFITAIKQLQRTTNKSNDQATSCLVAQAIINITDLALAGSLPLAGWANVWCCARRAEGSS
jgi:hypothetical protein